MLTNISAFSKGEFDDLKNKMFSIFLPLIRIVALLIL
jgi:hypothetical protein